MTVDTTTNTQPHRQQATAKLLSSLKSIVRKDKSHVPGQQHPGVTTREKPKAPKRDEAWHMATFSAQELSQERQAELMHETMLKKELAKFRSEVEGKFRASETNREFVYPRDDCCPAGASPSKVQIQVDCTHPSPLTSHVSRCDKSYHRSQPGPRGTLTQTTAGGPRPSRGGTQVARR